MNDDTSYDGGPQAIDTPEQVMGGRSVVAGAVGSTALSHAGGTRTEREERHGVVIIGSGVGGSIAAFRLAEAGVENVVLERGRRWPVTPAGDTFPAFPSPDRRLVWLDDDSTPLPPARGPLLSLLRRALAAALPRSTGLLDVNAQEGVVILSGAGVGGGTLIYGGVLAQPRPGPFRQLFPAELDYDEFDRVYYPRARKRLVAAPFPDDLLTRTPYDSNRLWSLAAQRSGLSAETIVSNYDFATVRGELDGTKTAATVIGQYHFTGCNSGAKMSVDRTYLARAEASGKTTVRALHRVTHVAQDHKGLYRVSVERLDESGTAVERLVFVCDRLILAAGVHTPRILLTARETGALPRLHESIGKGWGSNGDHLTIIRTSLVPVGAPQGGPPAVLVRNADGTAGVMHSPMPFPVGSGLLACLGMGISDHFGQWTMTADGRTKLNWKAEYDATARQAVNGLVRHVARYVPGGRPVMSSKPTHPVVAHPVGGVVLGRSTDAYGRLRGYSGLYCLDGSLMPGSTAAVNPVLTIAAVVERCLDEIITDFTRAW
ncbi:cholesterol oxidase [Saccharothrix carnea]|uniref:Cholesterol oxidase n=1 Tax=Saccharothrix carnea TaxID=1280637 RepID=A0A2P8I241_SACCR|nr:GMC oxidoreductase [Saccharothrix carnea]PSL52515.1 cholesterol oxidase [Saccharothrix carnea]